MHIKRVVTDLNVNGNIIRFKLNGVGIWCSTNNDYYGGIDTTEKNRGYGYNYKLGKLLIAIAYDKPGVTIDLKDKDVLFFLKRTKCLP